MKTHLPLDSASSHPLVTDLAATQTSIPAGRFVPPFQNDSSKVTMRLFGRSDQNLLTFGRVHFDAMEDNANFLEPRPSQATFGSALDAFAEDCAEVMALKSALTAAVARKNARREALIKQLDRRAGYVQSIAYGNKQVILSSALGVQRARQAVGPLPPPSGLQVVPGISEGTVTLTWDKVKHALLYYLEYGVEGEEPVQLSLSGRRKKKLTLRRLGAMYVFRIATAGTSGQSNWSAPVRRIAG